MRENTEPEVVVDTQSTPFVRSKIETVFCRKNRWYTMCRIYYWTLREI